MSALATILFWLLGAVLVVILTILVTPVRFEIALRKDHSWRSTVALRFLGGHGPKILLTGGEKREAKRKFARKKTPKKRRRSMRDRRAMGVNLVRLLGELLRCLKVRAVTVQARFGLDDPAETGQIYGALMPVVHGFGWPQRADVSFVPVFDERCLSGIARADIVFTPVALVPPILRFGWRIYGPSR